MAGSKLRKYSYGGLLYVRGERGKMNVVESYGMIRRKCLRVHMVCTRLIFVCEKRMEYSHSFYYPYYKVALLPTVYLIDTRAF